VVFLDHGVEAIQRELGVDSVIAREEQRSEIENFPDSGGDTSRLRTMRRVSHASIGSERSTPHVTVPDSEGDTMLAGVRPGNLAAYSRQKKLIRDVSANSSRFRNVKVGQAIPAQLTNSLNNMGGFGSPVTIKPSNHYTNFVEA
jgi:hypothetical protein